ncbi:hypothetical protein OROMI_011135 [Orobanche minor]
MSNRSKPSRNSLDVSIINDLKNMLHDNNSLVKSFRMVRERFQSDSDIRRRLKLIGESEFDGRIYNLPTVGEVAALIVGDFDESFNQRDVIVETRIGLLKQLEFSIVMLRQLDAPIGTNLPLENFFAFRIQERKHEAKTLLFSRMLFQQILVDGYTMVESERISYIKNNQSTLRSEKYTKLSAVALRGKQLPHLLAREYYANIIYWRSRYMMQNYQDAMAICKWFGYPDLFITITCNPKWPEIARFLDSRGLNPEDRPDIVCRLFKIKLDKIIKDMTENRIFGSTRAVIYTVEFQKRSLPHAHILLFLKRDRKTPTADDVDQIISAEIPDQVAHPRLYELVSTHMMHGPCSSSGNEKACMKKEKCTKRFPKRYFDRTIVDDDGYTIYKRRDNGYIVNKSGVILDNRFFVPHNPLLLMRYQSHINVDWCNQFRSIKYLFKYINKGNDRVTATISQENNDAVGEQPVDETQNYYNCRYVSPCEMNRTKQSMLLAWMECNRHYLEARSLTYLEFPTKFVWKRDERVWQMRKKGFAIGRLDYVPPGIGELYYLSLMLHRTPVLKMHVIHWGLLDDDKEYIDGIIEASFWGSPYFLRKLFASLLLSGSVSRPEHVWENTWKVLADDILPRQSSLLGIEDLHLSDVQLKNYTLTEIDNMLEKNGRSLRDYKGMPLPDDDMAREGNNRLIQQELNYDRSQLEMHGQLFLLLTDEQKAIYEEIINATSNDKGGIFLFMDMVGLEKPLYIWRTLSADLRCKGEIVLNVASSGVAALLLPSKRTAHSRFGIPINVSDKSICTITPGTELAVLINRTRLI